MSIEASVEKYRESIRKLPYLSRREWVKSFKEDFDNTVVGTKTELEDWREYFETSLKNQYNWLVEKRREKENELYTQLLGEIDEEYGLISISKNIRQKVLNTCDLDFLTEGLHTYIEIMEIIRDIQNKSIV